MFFEGGEGEIHYLTFDNVRRKVVGTISAALEAPSLGLLCFAIAMCAGAPSEAADRIELEIDAHNIVLHGIQHMHLAIPARAGPLTLAHPEWIPGEHRPNGPITQIVNVRIEANG